MHTLTARYRVTHTLDPVGSIFRRFWGVGKTTSCLYVSL